jgi:cold shock protein
MRGAAARRSCSWNYNYKDTAAANYRVSPRKCGKELFHGITNACSVHFAPAPIPARQFCPPAINCCCKHAGDFSDVSVIRKSLSARSSDLSLGDGMRRGDPPSSPVEQRMPQGMVKWFNTQKGYGFIQPQAGGKDIFVHISAVQRAGLNGLNEGQAVEYEEVANRGRTSAENLKVQR